MHTATPIVPPSPVLQMLEMRAGGELAATLAAWPLLRFAPRGDGHSVLVLPGLTAGDRSTRLLRTFLAEHGYDVHGWGQGRNLGPRPGVREAMQKQLEALHERSGRRVSIVGWSLGGAYAMRLAGKRPDLVRCAVSLGSPLSGQPRTSNAWRVYELASGKPVPARAPIGATPGVPMISIYSRSDGVVAWRASQLRGPLTENIEVVSSHVGLGVNTAVLVALADRLAQAEGHWKPFVSPARLRFLFPDPQRAA